MYADPSRACCVQCSHFFFTHEEAGLSDVTPGNSSGIGCWKSLWTRNDLWQTPEEFRANMARSQTCAEFRSVAG